ncbi:MFS transporter [Streptomyces sp. HMX112]|uniref:MFS transporter n=1 Tax=Streptomyces sp. HMX112 TaxID=3390850 RepID=UPI003A808E11
MRHSGRALLALGLDAILAPTLTPRLVARFGNTRVILGGFVLGAVAYALFLPLGQDWPYALMLPGLLLSGTAFALAYGPLTIAATDGVVERKQGLASGLLNTAMQFGSAVGISAVTAVYGVVAATGGRMDAFRAGLVVPVVMVALGALITLTGVRGRTGGRRVATGGLVGDDPAGGADGGAGGGAAGARPTAGTVG